MRVGGGARPRIGRWLQGRRRGRVGRCWRLWRLWRLLNRRRVPGWNVAGRGSRAIIASSSRDLSGRRLKRRGRLIDGQRWRGVWLGGRGRRRGRIVGGAAGVGSCLATIHGCWRGRIPWVRRGRWRRDDRRLIVRGRRCGVRRGGWHGGRILAAGRWHRRPGVGNRRGRGVAWRRIRRWVRRGGRVIAGLVTGGRVGIGDTILIVVHRRTPFASTTGAFWHLDVVTRALYSASSVRFAYGCVPAPRCTIVTYSTISTAYATIRDQALAFGAGVRYPAQ